jgi:hypothetical protein
MVASDVRELSILTYSKEHESSDEEYPLKVHGTSLPEAPLGAADYV